MFVWRGCAVGGWCHMSITKSLNTQKAYCCVHTVLEMKI